MRRLPAFLILVCIIALSLGPTPALAQGDGPTYIIQPGDTLSAIARRFGVSQDALIQANNIGDPSRLFPGQSLFLPGFPGVVGELGLHALSLGETLPWVAAQHNLDARSLARLNRMSRTDAAYAGQALIVPVKPVDVDQPAASSQRWIARGDTILQWAAMEGVSPWLTHVDAVRAWVLPGAGRPDPAAQSALPPFFDSLQLTPLPLVQGKTAAIHASVPPGFSLTGSLGEATLSFYPGPDGDLTTLQGIHALQEPGLLELRIAVYDGLEEQPIYEFNQRLLILEGGYGFQNLVGVPAETVDPVVTQPEEARIHEVLAPHTETKLWEGMFEFPSRYYTDEFISIFGTRRNYNYGALLYYHTGLDFYGQNVPIYAPADGIVVFADFLTVRGNATYLDHGWGVYSGYLHQSEIAVTVGERVTKGQVIGQVGATGRATGPHLHWEIWVGGVPVEPLDWITQSFP